MSVPSRHDVDDMANILNVFNRISENIESTPAIISGTSFDDPTPSDISIMNDAINFMNSLEKETIELEVPEKTPSPESYYIKEANNVFSIILADNVITSSPNKDAIYKLKTKLETTNFDDFETIYLLSNIVREKQLLEKIEQCKKDFKNASSDRQKTVIKRDYAELKKELEKVKQVFN